MNIIDSNFVLFEGNSSKFFSYSDHVPDHGTERKAERLLPRKQFRGIFVGAPGMARYYRVEVPSTPVSGKC
jgi:hypothetical protein